MRDYNYLSDEDLLTRMRAGDEGAFTALYRRRQGAVYRFAWQMSGSAELAEDVTQEVFLALITGSNNFDTAKGTLINYLYGATRFQVLRRWEREKRFRPLLTADDDDGEAFALDTALPDVKADLFRQMARREVIERVREAVLKLPPHYREVVALCDLHELDYVTAAEIIGCAVGTVRSRLHRARALLANRLQALQGAADDAAEGLAQAAQVWA